MLSHVDTDYVQSPLSKSAFGTREQRLSGELGVCVGG